MKPPYSMPYPNDRPRDAGHRACGLEAPRLWIEVSCITHQGQLYGELVAAGSTEGEAA
jgi:hypothetical protein